MGRNVLSIGFAVLLLLPLVLSCRQDEPILPVPPTPDKGETAQMTLSIRVPGFRKANTRAMQLDEEKINEITLLLFANEGGTEKVKLKKNVTETEFYYLSQERVLHIPVIAGTYTRIALIANASAELSGISVGSTYEALKQVEATGRFGQKWDGTGTNPRVIPMYGEYAPTGGFQMKAGVSQTIAQAIPLIRMLARVDIVLPTSAGASGISEEVYFVNPAGNGRIWVNTASYNTGAAESGYLAPTLPGTLQKANGGDPITGMADASKPQLITYYLNEQAATSTTLTTENNSRPCIVLQLDYKGTIYYYRLDYAWDGVKGGGTGAYARGKHMPILRNHRYMFTIQAVKGPGYKTLTEAIKHDNYAYTNSIVVNTVVLDEDDRYMYEDDKGMDIVFSDEGYFLSVSRKEIALSGNHSATSTANTFVVRSNSYNGFIITAHNADGTDVPTANPWLQSSVNQKVWNNSDGSRGSVLVHAITNTSSGPIKRGYLMVRAGRLYIKVNVRLGKLPLEYVAEHNLAGGYHYGRGFDSSVPPGALLISAQTEYSLYWALNRSNDQSGYYNWYVLNGKQHPTHNPEGRNLFHDGFFKPGNPGHGWHLPSLHEMRSLFNENGYVKYSSSIVQSAVKEACQFGSVKRTFDADYYSTGNGVCYAFRFKKSSTSWGGSSDYPLATDNSMLCAYRYTRVGSLVADNNVNSYVKVECAYLGESGASTNITTIRDDAWWNARKSEVVTRIFPCTGFLNSTSNVLYSRGKEGWYWSSAENGSIDGHGMYVHPDGSFSHYTGSKVYGFAVRLFSDYD